MKEGDDLGEYFGSTLLVLDVNNDGRDDLVVGAPHFGAQNQQGDSGRIFVYTSSGYVCYIDFLSVTKQWLL